MEPNFKIIVYVDTLNSVELPQFGQEKQLKCTPETSVIKLLEYLSNNLKFEKHILSRDYSTSVVD